MQHSIEQSVRARSSGHRYAQAWRWCASGSCSGGASFCRETHWIVANPAVLTAVVGSCWFRQMVKSRRVVNPEVESCIVARANAVRLYRIENNFSTVARLMGRSRHFVRDAVERQKEDHRYTDRPRIGRPRATTHSDRVAIRRMAREPKYGSIRTVQAALTHRGKKFGYGTIRRAIKAGGMRSYAPTDKPKMSADVREQRLVWARNHINESTQIARSRVFADEKFFYLDDRKVRVWRYPHEERPVHETGSLRCRARPRRVRFGVARRVVLRPCV
jgi:transposase